MNDARLQKILPKERNRSHDIEGNVYADIGINDADKMQVKAQLATTISTMIKHRGLTQAQAARVPGLTQPKRSNLLRGQFRGISEAKTLECLTRLGRDVRIVVGKPRGTPGSLNVVFAG